MHRSVAGQKKGGNRFVGSTIGGSREKPQPKGPSEAASAPARAQPASESGRKPRLFEQVREVMRFKHYSIRTEEAYLGWMRRFILFHGKRHPELLGTEEVRAFLTALAVKGKVAAPTQNQALSALLFLYQQVLKKEIGWLKDVERAQRPAKLPVVCTPAEVRAILAEVRGGTMRLRAHLLYGSGLRLMECIRLRVEDVDFGYTRIVVRDGKGNKDRLTMLAVLAFASRWSDICKRPSCYSRKTWRKVSAKSSCLLRWRGNTRVPQNNGRGRRYSRRHGGRATHAIQRRRSGDIR